jgi:parallel beta-helix repeat protein
MLTNLLGSGRLAAADFHVAGARGNDANDGLSANEGPGATGPLATLQALQRLAPRGGDRVLLRCGERFSGPLELSLNEPGASLVIASYGECARDGPPVIDGRRSLGTLAAAGGAVQSLALPQQPVALVYAGDEPLQPALWPRDGWLIVPPGTAPRDDALPALAALAGRDLAGAQLRARTQEWWVEERVLSAPAGADSLVFDSKLRYPLQPARGLLLAGKGWMVESNSGRFAADTAALRLVLAAVPESAGLPLAQVPAGPLLRVKGRGSAVVDGIALHAAGGDALSIHVDGEVAVRGVRVTQAAGNGIAVAGAPRAEISGNQVSQTGLDGIFFAEVKNAQVRGNLVRDAGLFGGPRPALAGINVHRTDAARIEGNWVDGSAYIGIRFSGDTLVRGNVVLRSCRLLSDCAGLYTWRRNANDERPVTRIVGNVVFDAAGDTRVKTGVNDWFVGIYADDFSNAVEITGNVVAGVNQGIYVHNAWGVTVRGNVVRAAQRPLIDASDPAKVPRVRERPNRLIDNDAQVGRPVLALQDAEGLPLTPQALVAAQGPLTAVLRPRETGTALAASALACTTPSRALFSELSLLWRLLDCP